MPEDSTGRLAVARVLGRLWLRLFGWTLECHALAIPAKFVFIAAPHTSGWDLPFMLATAGALVIRTAELFGTSGRLVLGIPPEGTRRKVEYWRSGFYHIAVRSGVPIGLGFLDYAGKRCG